MFEIYSETPYRMARENRRDHLNKSQYARMILNAKSQMPRIWDYINLRLGNWLIELGGRLKSHSVFSQPTNNRA